MPSSTVVPVGRENGISIASLNPDTDGDGKVEPWETEVFDRIKKADEDKSGSISVKELFNVIKGAAESDKQKKLFQKISAFAGFVIVLLIGSNVATSVAAGEMIKESRVAKGGMMTGNDGSAVKVDIAETDYDLYTLPTLDITELAKLKRMNVYVDGTSSAFLGNEVAEASFTLSGVIKLSDTSAKFLTPSGSVITLNSDTNTGSVTFAGDTTAYAVTDGSNTEGAFSVIPPSDRRLENNRRAARRGAFLSTSGSFTLSSGGGNRAGTGGRR